MPVLALALLALLPALPARGWEVELKGQLSGWVGADSESRPGLGAGLRYIPTLSVRRELGRGFLLDAEASLNARVFTATDSLAEFESEVDLDPYRLWVRLSSSQLELRAGLQKINFGPARLLRALRWFDQLDPRDPLSLTDGVYALLGRYYFLNNANIWLWVLYGNEDLKGSEIFPTLDDSVELGGRAQLPLLRGGLGVSYHHRRAELSGAAAKGPGGGHTPEDRFALDGRWDAGVGLWFEGVLIRRDSDIGLFRREKALNLGLDYTFDLGNGLGLNVEHLLRDFSEELFESEKGEALSALSLSYPLSLNDTLGAILYYDWNNEEFYVQLSWKKIFDDWSFHLIGFANPDRGRLGRDGEGNLPASGKGVLVVFTFNH